MDKIFHGDIDIDGSVYHSSNRVKRNHGGIIIYTKNNFSSTKVLKFSNSKFEMVGVLLDKSDT